MAVAPVVYTDDTGWAIHGEGAQLMAFDTDQATVFQIRSQHRNEEVRELIPADYAGVTVTDSRKTEFLRPSKRSTICFVRTARRPRITVIFWQNGTIADNEA